MVSKVMTFQSLLQVEGLKIMTTAKIQRNASRSNVRGRKVYSKSKLNKDCKAEQQRAVKGLTKSQYEQIIIEHRDNGKKLARSILRKWRVRMLPEEIDSIVDLTLCEAASRFSYSHGASFMTFFFYHLRGQLVRAVATAANSSSLLVTLNQNSEINSGDWSLSGVENARTILNDELEISPSEIQTPEEALLTKEVKDICSDACSRLDELEQVVVNRSFEGDESLVDIAKSLGYSRCHISRVKKKALDRIKNVITHSDIASDLLKDKIANAKKTKRMVQVKRRSRRKRLERQSTLLYQDKAAKRA